jgi:hypothetical protein
MNMTICGPEKGTEDEPYRCICCLKTFADIERLAVGICWDCLSGNFECEICLSRGVPFNRFKRNVPETLHKFAYWVAGPKSIAVSVCGISVPYENIGQGVFILKDCELCWGEQNFDK